MVQVEGLTKLYGEFTAVNAPRLSQLINKSNQFNLTTRRRTEPEVLTVMSDPAHAGFSMRLKDRFGDNGIIARIAAAAVKAGSRMALSPRTPAR